MKIAVIGPGAIGGLAAAYLAQKGSDVTLIGHAEAVEAISEGGLHISGARGDLDIKIDIFEKLDFSPDLVILATKTQDIKKALSENLIHLKDSLLLTTQNGVRSDIIASEFIKPENIVSSIVMFGATYLEPGRIVHNFEGAWIIGKLFGPNDAAVDAIRKVIEAAFTTVVSEDIKGMKYLKLFVNANNCIPAILGKSMQESFSDPAVSAISIAIWKEGLNVVSGAGIKLTSLPDFPLERLTKLAVLPTEEAAKIFTGIMTNLSKEPLFGSILQSIKRGRSSEIDYINGEFVSLARAHNLKAPLNEKLVSLVHQVETDKRFLTKGELISSAKGLVH